MKEQSALRNPLHETPILLMAIICLVGAEAFVSVSLYSAVSVEVLVLYLVIVLFGVILGSVILGMLIVPTRVGVQADKVNLEYRGHNRIIPFMMVKRPITSWGPFGAVLVFKTPKGQMDYCFVGSRAHRLIATSIERTQSPIVGGSGSE